MTKLQLIDETLQATLLEIHSMAKGNTKSFMGKLVVRRDIIVEKSTSINWELIQ